MSRSGDAVRSAFEGHFGVAAEAAVHVPGRVVLLGETTASSHLPLLAFTLPLGFDAAAAADNSGAVEVASGQYEPAVTISRAAHDTPIAAPWQRCAVGAAHVLAGAGEGRGARVYFSSDLPKGAGLGSRAAMTTALTAVLAGTWGTGREAAQVAALSAAAQRHAGFDAEGADQQVQLRAEEDALLRVELAPAALDQLPFPAGYTFVIAALQRDHESVNAARAPRDERIVGARIAAAMLADQVGLDTGVPPRLADVVAVEVAELLADELPEKISAKEVSRGVTVDQEHLVQLTSGRVDPLARVPVRRVARHLLGEAARVEEARAALAAGEMAAFGRVLDTSHESLRQDFQTTGAGVDALCSALRAAGALGARMLGDGATAAVALCPVDGAGTVLAAAREAGAVEVFEARPAGGFAWL